MLGACGVIAFVTTTDPARARSFYENVLGLRFVEDDHFALVFDMNGTMLRVVKMKSVTPVQHTILGWTVPDIRRAIAALSAKGVKFDRYQGLPQDELGIWTAPGGAQIAWFKDPDGNNLSLTQFPK